MPVEDRLASGSRAALHGKRARIYRGALRRNLIGWGVGLGCLKQLDGTVWSMRTWIDAGAPPVPSYAHCPDSLVPWRLAELIAIRYLTAPATSNPLEPQIGVRTVFVAQCSEQEGGSYVPVRSSVLLLEKEAHGLPGATRHLH